MTTSDELLNSENICGDHTVICNLKQIIMAYFIGMYRSSYRPSVETQTLIFAFFLVYCELTC